MLHELNTKELWAHYKRFTRNKRKNQRVLMNAFDIDDHKYELLKLKLNARMPLEYKNRLHYHGIRFDRTLFRVVKADGRDYWFKFVDTNNSQIPHICLVTKWSKNGKYTGVDLIF